MRVAFANCTKVNANRKEKRLMTVGAIDNQDTIFLDENINQHYTNEKIFRNQIVLFTLIAIGIACLGLLGTVSNKAVEKTKEIIRKILVEKMHEIAGILLNTSIKQVIVASAISLPVAYYLTEQYLQNFPNELRCNGGTMQCQYPY